MALGEMVADYFIERGFVHFASFVPKHAWWGTERFTGFEKALLHRDYTCNIFREGKDSKDPFFLKDERFATHFQYWLSQLPKPCALLAGTDTYAKRAISVCHLLGIAVPEEIAILGVDNDEWFCQLQTPQLSSVCQDGRRIGYEGAKLLYHLIQGGKRPKKPILIPPIYIATRQSTDIIAVIDQDMVQAIQYLREHIEEAPTVYHVVKTIGLSRRTLERRFLKQFGRTIKSEITRLRINRCKELLRNTTLSIAGIARKMNFSSMEHFIKTFRLHEKMSPNEYRKQVIAHRISGTTIGPINQRGSEGAKHE